MRALPRVVAFALAGLAACGGANRGPAWPKSAGHVVPATWQEDGGESIDPHVANDTSAIEHSDQTMGTDSPSTTGDEVLDVLSTPNPTAVPDPKTPPSGGATRGATAPSTDRTAPPPPPPPPSI